MRHASSGTTRVLIVEDKVIIGLSLQKTLEGLGYPLTETVPDKEEAAETAARFRPHLALVDLDLQGNGDPLLVARRLREAGVPLVFLGTDTSDERLRVAETLDPFGYLHKPISERDLALTIEMAARRARAEQELRERSLQQDAIARLGIETLGAREPDAVMNRVLQCAAATLRVPFARIVELTPDGTHVLLKYGVGWPQEAIGKAFANSGRGSLSGFALEHEGPVITVDLRHETRFFVPPLLREHHIVSSLMTVIQGTDGPYGVIAVDSNTPRHFSESDIDFLQSLANLLSAFLLQRRNLAYAESILENAVDPYLSTDAQGRITDWNPAAEALLGWSRREILGKDLAETLVPARQREEYHRSMKRLRSAPGRHLNARFDLVAMARDGEEIPVQVALFSTRRDGEHWFNAFLHDRRAHRETEQALARDRAESAEERDRFYRFVSHDLREPLVGIQLYCQLLERQYGPALGTEGIQYLHYVVGNAKRMDELVQTLGGYLNGERDASALPVKGLPTPLTKTGSGR